MAQEPASIRYKNPGAMWGSALAIKWGAEKKPVSLKDGTGQGNNIAVFPTYVQGICAQLDLWRTSRNYRNKRFCDAIAVWSGGNHVESYIKFVLARVPGMTRNTVMDDAFWRSSMGIAFLKAQAWHEAGKPYPAPDADWIAAQRIVFADATARKPLVKSKIAQGSATIGAVEAGDAIATANDVLSKVADTKDATDRIGITDMIMAVATNPRFIIAVLIVVVCAGIIYWRWRDHGRGR